MMVLWTPVLFGLTLMVLLHALWEMAGYFSFRPSTYERTAGEPLAVFDGRLPACLGPSGSS